MYTILLAVSEPVTARYLKSVIISRGFRLCAIVSSGNEAVAQAESHHPDLVLLDIILGSEQDSIEAANAIHKRWGIPVIFLSDSFDQMLFKLAAEAEPFAFIIKHSVEESLDTAIYSAMKFARLEHDFMKREEMFHSLLSVANGAAFRIQSCNTDAVKGVTGGTIEFISDEIELLTGVSARSLTGADVILLRDLIHPDDRIHVDSAIKKAIDEAGHYTTTYRLSGTPGYERSIRETGRILNGPGDTLFIDAMLVDISQLSSD